MITILLKMYTNLFKSLKPNLGTELTRKFAVQWWEDRLYNHKGSHIEYQRFAGSDYQIQVIGRLTQSVRYRRLEGSHNLCHETPKWGWLDPGIAKIQCS